MREHRVRRPIPPYRDRHAGRGHTHFVERARLNGCDLSRHAFLQQQFGRLDSRLGVETVDHPIAKQRIGQGDKRHPLMVGEVGRNDDA